MSLNVSALGAYTNENLLPLIKKSVLEGRTNQLITVQPGIKSAATINTIGSTIVAQAGACGWNPGSTTTLGQRPISVNPIKIDESICLNTLEDYYTQVMMRPGSYNEEIPFEAIYAAEKAEKINTLIEDIEWKGDTVNGSGNLALADGFIKYISASIADDSLGVLASTGSLTANNILDRVDNMIALVPTDVIAVDDLKLLVGYDTYRTYAKELRDANLFHYKGDEGANFRMYAPGTNVEVVAVRGLNSTNKAFLTPASNMIFGTDLLNDAESFDIWYSKDNDEVRFKAKFKMGVAVAFPEFVVAHL
jgi:hypothetical protein